MWRREPVLDGGDEAEKRRRNGAVLASFALVLALVLLAGGVCFVAVTPEPVTVGNYVLLGPNVRKAGDLVVMFGTGPGSSTQIYALTPQLGRAAASPVRNPWLKSSRRLNLPVGAKAYVSVPTPNGFAMGRLIVDLWGFRLLGP